MKKPKPNIAFAVKSDSIENGTIYAPTLKVAQNRLQKLLYIFGVGATIITATEAKVNT
jgi:hypothetical protein